MSVGPVDVRVELANPDLPRRLEALRFRPEDAAEVVEALAVISPRELDRVQQYADRLLPRIGQLPAGGGDTVWADLDDPGNGLVPLLALLATARPVADYHASRGIAPADSWAGLADLGQQVAVHRFVHGDFGLETYGWLAGHVWTGSMVRLGRLQFDLERVPRVDGAGEDWVIGTHIPRSGPLAPAAVDASLAAARPFFAAHFPDVPAYDVHCQSWMLEPRLPVLLPGTNLAAFQQRWRIDDQRADGDADVAYFAFGTRDLAGAATVPPSTALQRVVQTVWAADEHWHVVSGRLA